MEVTVIDEEVWKEIPINTKVPHKVSNLGRISNLDNTIRKVTKKKDGYLKTNFRINGKNTTFSIHKLVMLAFVGPPSTGYTIDHIDGNKENNTLSNLEYVTHLENMHRGFSLGTISKIPCTGINNVKAKLSIDEVTEIRKLYSSKLYTQQKLAEKFGVDQTQISCIVRRKNWASVE